MEVSAALPKRSDENKKEARPRPPKKEEER